MLMQKNYLLTFLHNFYIKNGISKWVIFYTIIPFLDRQKKMRCGWLREEVGAKQPGAGNEGKGTMEKSHLSQATAGSLHTQFRSPICMPWIQLLSHHHLLPPKVFINKKMESGRPYPRYLMRDRGILTTSGPNTHSPMDIFKHIIQILTFFHNNSNDFQNKNNR